MYLIDKSFGGSPEPVSDEERGNLALLELAHNLRTRYMPRFDMRHYDSCAIHWAAQWDLVPKLQLSNGKGTLDSYDKVNTAFSISEEAHAHLFGGGNLWRYLFGSYNYRTATKEAAVLEAFVAARRARQPALATERTP